MGNLLKIKEFLILGTLIILVILPIAYGFFFIDKYGVNIPIADQWGQLVPWTIQYYEGTFDPTTLITRQNDSRAFFPNIVMVSISVVTKLDIKAMFYAGYLFFVCFMGFIAWLFYTELNIRKKYFFLFLLPVFYYAFNPYYLIRFIQNLGSVTAPMILLFALLTIYTLDLSKNKVSEKRKYLFFAISIVFGVMCSFSGAPGLPIWIAGLLQISIQNTKDKIKKGILWITAAGALFYIYFIALEFNTGSSPIRGSDGYTGYIVTAITFPFNKFLCFMGVIGAEVIHSLYIALFFGMILTGVFILLLYNNRNSLDLDKYSKWYALLAFGTLTGLALALTRSGAVQVAKFGSPETIFYIPAMRHSLYIFLPMICFYILALMYTKDSADKPVVLNKINSKVSAKMLLNKIIFGLILTLMICGALLHVIPGIDAASKSHDQNTKSQYYLLNYEFVSDDKLKQINPSPEKVKTYAPGLEKYNLNVFSNSTDASFRI